MTSRLFLVSVLAAMPSLTWSQRCATPGWRVGATRTLWRSDVVDRLLVLESALYLPAGLLLVGRMQDSVQAVSRLQGTTVVRLATNGDSTLRDLGIPAGLFTFVQPQLMALRGGRAMMVWGEPVPKDPSEIDEHALWSSTYGPSGWSSPQRIDLLGRRVQWNPRRRALVASTDGSVHLFLDPNTTAGFRPGVIHLTTDGTAWRHYEFAHQLPIGAAYLGGAAAGEQLHVAFIGAPPRDSTGRNALYFRSHRGGSEWTPQQLLFHRSPSEAHSVAVTSTPDGAVHVMWGQGNGFSKTELFHMSTNGREAWSLPRSVGLPATSAPLPLSVLPLRTNDVLALVEGPRDVGLQIVRICPQGQDRPMVAMRGLIPYGVSLLLHGAHGSPVLLTSGIIPVGEKRGDAVWLLTTLTSRRP